MQQPFCMYIPVIVFLSRPPLPACLASLESLHTVKIKIPVLFEPKLGYNWHFRLQRLRVLIKFRMTVRSWRFLFLNQEKLLRVQPWCVVNLGPPNPSSWGVKGWSAVECSGGVEEWLGRGGGGGATVLKNVEERAGKQQNRIWLVITQQVSQLYNWIKIFIYTRRSFTHFLACRKYCEVHVSFRSARFIMKGWQFQASMH